MSVGDDSWIELPTSLAPDLKKLSRRMRRDPLKKLAAAATWSSPKTENKEKGQL